MQPYSSKFNQFTIQYDNQPMPLVVRVSRLTFLNNINHAFSSELQELLERRSPVSWQFFVAEGVFR